MSDALDLSSLVGKNDAQEPAEPSAIQEAEELASRLAAREQELIDLEQQLTRLEEEVGREVLDALPDEDEPPVLAGPPDAALLEESPLDAEPAPEVVRPVAAKRPVTVDAPSAAPVEAAPASTPSAPAPPADVVPAVAALAPDHALRLERMEVHVANVERKVDACAREVLGWLQRHADWERSAAAAPSPDVGRRRRLLTVVAGVGLVVLLWILVDLR